MTPTLRRLNDRERYWGLTWPGWGAAAAAFSIVMGLSRAYLGAHWLSDAIAGIGLGTSCALVTALVTDQLQRRRRQGPQPRRAPPPAGVRPPRHVRSR